MLLSAKAIWLSISQYTASKAVAYSISKQLQRSTALCSLLSHRSSCCKAKSRCISLVLSRQRPLPLSSHSSTTAFLDSEVSAACCCALAKGLHNPSADGSLHSSGREAKRQHALSCGQGGSPGHRGCDRRASRAGGAALQRIRVGQAPHLHSARLQSAGMAQLA